MEVSQAYQGVSVVRGQRHCALDIKQKAYLSSEISARTKIYVGDDIRPHRQSIEEMRKSKSLASIRLMAATKMRVKSVRPAFKPHLFHPFTKYCPETESKRTGSAKKQKVINYASTITSPFYILQLRTSVQLDQHLSDIDRLKRDIRQELRKRQLERKAVYNPKVRIQSGKPRSGVITGSTLRASSAKNIRQTPANQLSPWQPNRQQVDQNEFFS